MRVLLTRNTQHNRLMSREIETRFAHLSPIIFAAPLLEQVVIAEANNALKNLLSDKRIDDVIFISPSAVQFGFDKVSEFVKLPRFFAVGQGTANMLKTKLQKEAKNIEVVFPKEQVGSEALLSLPEMQKVENNKILIVTGAQGKPLLENTLIERLAKITRWECYQRQKPSGLSQQLKDCLLGGLDCVFLHSAHAARHFLEELPQEVQTQSILAIVGANSIAEELVARGWSGRILVAASPMPVDMVFQLQRVTTH